MPYPRRLNAHAFGIGVRLLGCVSAVLASCVRAPVCSDAPQVSPVIAVVPSALPAPKVGS